MAQIATACTQAGRHALARSREGDNREIIRRDNQRADPKRKSVTPVQVQRIRDLYAVTKNGHEVARIMGLGSTTVYNHLGLGRAATPAWTDDQIQVMVDGYLDKRPPREIAAQVDRSPRAVRARMCRYRKAVRSDPKKRRALSAIALAFKAVRKADIFRELEV